MTTTPTQIRSTTDGLADRKRKQRRITVIGAIAGLALAGAVALGVSSFASGAAPTPTPAHTVSPAHPSTPGNNVSPAHPSTPGNNVSPAHPSRP